MTYIEISISIYGITRRFDTTDILETQSQDSTDYTDSSGAISTPAVFSSAWALVITCLL
jgi:hypothetical protein